MGDGRGEGSLTIRDSGQAAVSLTPDVDGTGSGVYSVYHLKQSSDRYKVIAIFFLP